MFFGSALTNFGVRLLLDAVVDLAPPPSPARRRRRRAAAPLDAPFSGFVFKVQANMDPSHRDRIAFVRVCSGRFERGMVVTHGRTGKPFATKYAHSVFGQERETIEEACPGDVVGLVNATDVRVGDTLYARRARRVPAASRASPPSTSSIARVPRHRPVQAVPHGASPSSTRRAWCRCCATPTSATRRRCSPPSARCSSRWRRTGSSTSSARRSSCSPTALPGGPPHRRGERAGAAGACAASTCCARADGTLLALFESPTGWSGSRPTTPSSRLERLVAEGTAG